MGCCVGKQKRRQNPRQRETFRGVGPSGGTPTCSDQSPLDQINSARTAGAEEQLDRCAARLDQLQESTEAACEQAQQARRCAANNSVLEQARTTLTASETRLVQLLHQAEVEVERPLDAVEVAGTTCEQAIRDRRKKYNRRLSDIIARLEAEKVAVHSTSTAAAVLAAPSAGSTLGESLQAQADPSQTCGASLPPNEQADIVLERARFVRGEDAVEALGRLEFDLAEFEERTNVAVAAGVAGRRDLQLVLQTMEFGYEDELNAVSNNEVTEESGLTRRRADCNRRLQVLRTRIDEELARTANGASGFWSSSTKAVEESA